MGVDKNRPDSRVTMASEGEALGKWGWGFQGFIFLHIDTSLNNKIDHRQKRKCLYFIFTNTFKFFFLSIFPLVVYKSDNVA